MMMTLKQVLIERGWKIVIAKPRKIWLSPAGYLLTWNDGLIWAKCFRSTGYPVCHRPVESN